jgi:non-ribosomal peptide synthetase component F
MMFTGYLNAPQISAERLRPMPRAMRELTGFDADEGAVKAMATHAAEARRLAEADGADPETWAPIGPDAAGCATEAFAYRTGDLCRLLPSGDLQVLGRADSTWSCVMTPPT